MKEEKRTKDQLLQELESQRRLISLMEALIASGWSAEREISDSEQRLLQVIEAAPNGLVLVGHEGTMLLVNSQAEQIFGYERQELIGQLLEMLVPVRFRDSHVRLRTEHFPEAANRGITWSSRIQPSRYSSVRRMER